MLILAISMHHTVFKYCNSFLAIYWHNNNFVIIIYKKKNKKIFGTLSI